MVEALVWTWGNGVGPAGNCVCTAAELWYWVESWLGGGVGPWGIFEINFSLFAFFLIQLILKDLILYTNQKVLKCL